MSTINKYTLKIPFVCEIPNCQYVTPTYNRLKVHMEYKHSYKSHLFCEYSGCTFVTDTFTKLRTHVLNHISKELYIYKTVGCNFNTYK